MSVIGGYQSDVNLQDVVFTGNFPIEHSLGGYGQTTGATDHYKLSLSPPISQYQVGINLQIKFNHANMGVASINIDDNGITLLKKAVNGLLVNLTANDINNKQIYHLIYDGSYFQVVTGIRPQIPAASQGTSGIARLATQALVDTGSDDSRIVTPLKLATKLTAELATKEDLLGNPPIDGFLLQSTSAGIRSWRAINQRLYTNYASPTGSPTTSENDLGSGYTLAAGTLVDSASLEINISGDIQSAAGNKTLRVYLGNEVIFTYTSSVVGPWSINIVGGRLTTSIFKGVVTMLHSTQPPVVQIIQTLNLNMDTTPQLIRITHQNELPGISQINRFLFLIRHIV